MQSYDPGALSRQVPPFKHGMERQEPGPIVGIISEYLFLEKLNIIKVTPQILAQIVRIETSFNHNCLDEGGINSYIRHFCPYYEIEKCFR